MNAIELIEGLDQGNCGKEVQQALLKLIKGVQLTNSSGSITLKVGVAPVKGSEGRLVAVAHEVTTKIPKPTPIASVFHVDANNHLSVDDPNQLGMPGMEGGDGSPGIVDQSTGEILEANA